MKRNQIMITTLAIMIAIAGYLTFTGRTGEEETVVVNDQIVVEDDMTALLDLSEEDILSDLSEQTGEIPSIYERTVIPIAKWQIRAIDFSECPL